MKEFINDIKENFIGDMLFLISGAVVGYAIKVLINLYLK